MVWNHFHEMLHELIGYALALPSSSSSIQPAPIYASQFLFHATSSSSRPPTIHQCHQYLLPLPSSSSMLPAPPPVPQLFIHADSTSSRLPALHPCHQHLLPLPSSSSMPPAPTLAPLPVPKLFSHTTMPPAPPHFPQHFHFHLKYENGRSGASKLLPPAAPGANWPHFAQRSHILPMESESPKHFKEVLRGHWKS